MKNKKILPSLLLVYGVFSALLFFVFPVVPVEAAEDVDEIEDDIEKLEDKIKDAEKKKESIARDLSVISSSLSVTQQLIARTQNLLLETSQTIGQKEVEIKNLEDRLTLERKLLTKLIQELYYSGNTSPMVELILHKEELNDFFSYGDSLVSTQERLEGVMSEMKVLQEKLGEEKKSLEEAKENHESALAIQNKQKQSLAFQQAEVVDDLEDQEATISELQSKLQELRSDLSVLTGKSFNAKDIKEAVEYASKETGVPKGVLYGFLKMETNLGVNTGQCTYEQVKKDALNRYYNKNKKKYKNSIALLEKRHDIFKDIVDELGYSKNKKVSCTPRSYVGQGGAMGVAQFMADTWRGYESQIASKTGSKDPDPWDLADGVMGLALKVRKAGATSDSSSAIRKASINYLGAFNTNYYNGIVYWSKNYKRLFD